MSLLVLAFPQVVFVFRRVASPKVLASTISAVPPDVRRWLRPAVKTLYGLGLCLSAFDLEPKTERSQDNGHSPISNPNLTAGQSLRRTSGGIAVTTLVRLRLSGVFHRTFSLSGKLQELRRQTRSGSFILMFEEEKSLVPVLLADPLQPFLQMRF
jgi:hypothetical protein